MLLWFLEVHNSPIQHDHHRTLALISLIVMSVAALYRRVGQPWVLVVAVLTLAADVLAGSLLMTILLFTDIVYAAALYSSPRVSRAIQPLALAATVSVTVAGLLNLPSPQSMQVAFFSALIILTPAMTGLVVRRHRDESAAERLRAEQTALLAEMDRRQAINAERARMARELHDVVAGHLSAIAVHSTAAQTLHDREATTQALEVIRSNSVQGLAEMRRLIGLLRSSNPDEEYDQPAAAPKLSGLPALVEQANSSADGLRFTLQDGHRGDCPLPAPVELAAYRLVQESLTNAVKHSALGEVSVALTREQAGTEPVTDPHQEDATDQSPPLHASDVLVITVSNPLEPGIEPRVPGSGAGLTGMRERVALLGGEFTAGPRQNHWLTHAVLPLYEGADHR